MFKRGEISLDKPPKGFGLDFDRWSVRKFGVKAYVENLKKNSFFADSPKEVAYRLRILGVSTEEIESLSKKAPTEKQIAARTLMAKVMTLGNRLATRMERRTAFVLAWQIVKVGSVTFPVRGVTIGSRQEALRRLNTYESSQIRTFLLPEPTNPVDSNAIAVMCGINGGKFYYKLGYIPADSTATAASIKGKASIRVLPGDTHGARLTLQV
jgi:hypothetical protein